jgi:trk system potassium uptake protein TrkA
MLALIAGGGRTAAQLANLLLALKHEVHLIEQRRDILSRLHRELPTEVIYEADPTDPAALEVAGIRGAQVLVACLPDDANNLLICYLARSRFGVPRIIAQIDDPRNAWLFDSKFHVDVALSQADILSSLIEEEMSLGDMMTLLKVRRGQYSVVEEKIPAGAKAVGVAIKDLALPEECVIAAIIRKGRMVLPRGPLVMEAGDEVLAVTGRPGADRLAALFAQPQLAALAAEPAPSEAGDPAPKGRGRGKSGGRSKSKKAE